MKKRSTVSTLASLSTAMNVNFSFFDALECAESNAASPVMRRPLPKAYGRPLPPAVLAGKGF